MNGRWVLLAGLLFGCESGEPLAKEGLVGGKADDATWAKACRDAGLEPDCDLCAYHGWYEDAVCDAFCPEHDPSCSAETGDGWDLYFDVQDAAVHGSVLHLLDREVVRRFDAATGKFLPPLRGPSAPLSMAVAADDGTVYVGHESGQLSVFAPGATTPSPFATTAGRVTDLVVAGDRLYAEDQSNGTWVTRSLFDRSGGGLLGRAGSSSDMWSHAFHRSRDVIHAVDLSDHVVTIELAGGTLRDVDGAFDAGVGAGFTPPVRITPGDRSILLGSGRFLDPATLDPQPQELGTTFQDVAFVGNDFLVLRAVASGPDTWSSELLTISGALAISSTRALAGWPGRVLTTPDQVVVVTRVSPFPPTDEPPRHHLVLLPR